MDYHRGTRARREWPFAKGIMRRVLISPLRTYFRYTPWKWGKRLLWQHVADHLWWLETRVTTSTEFGCIAHVDARDIVGRYIYYFGVWEPPLTQWIKERLSPGDVFIDVGAHVGYYTLLASTLVGDSGKVVAVEASPEIFEILRSNVELNHADNVRPVNIAAWCSEETAPIFTWPECPPGITTLVPSWARLWNLEEHGSVRAAPLSNILESNEIQRARIVKIDVEGAEWQVLYGMKSLLDDCRPDLEIVVEFTAPARRGNGKAWADLLRFFDVLGFHSYSLENDYSVAPYISRRLQRPERLKHMPADTFQMDVVFSRVDSVSL